MRTSRVDDPIAGKQTIAATPGMPPGRLPAIKRTAVDAILRELLERGTVLTRA